MKKLIILTVVAIFATMAICIDANAARKTAKKKSMAPEIVQQMSDEIDFLTRKIYGNALLSPEDNQKLIDVKIKLDNQMLIDTDTTLTPLYYKAGMLYKKREMKEEAIACFQTILENFSDTALAPKARAELRSMGVEVQEPKLTTGSEDEEEE